MPNVEYCSVCGYALKKMDAQCGRCGETVRSDVFGSGETEKSASADPRFAGGYAIETIGGGGGAEAAGTPVVGANSQYGIREMNQKQTRSEKEKSVEALQQELKDLNERIARMDAEKKMALNNRTGASTQEQAKGEAAKSGMLTYLRRRNEAYFKSQVRKHVTAIQNLVRRDARGAEPAVSEYHSFLDRKIVNPGLYNSSIVLFVGPPGSMKSTMAASTASRMAKSAGGKGLYVLLDDRKSKFERRLNEHGIHDLDSGTLQIVDSGDIRKNSPQDEGGWHSTLMNYIQQQLNGKGYRFLVLDNLNALASMVSTDKERASTFGFFSWLRRLGLTTIVIREGEYTRALSSRKPEIYLADGIIQFNRRKKKGGDLEPMFRVLKMRGAEIDGRYYALQLSSGSLKFVPAAAT